MGAAFYTKNHPAGRSSGFEASVLNQATKTSCECRDPFLLKEEAAKRLIYFLSSTTLTKSLFQSEIKGREVHNFMGKLLEGTNSSMHQGQR